MAVGQKGCDEASPWCRRWEHQPLRWHGWPWMLRASTWHPLPLFQRQEPGPVIQARMFGLAGGGIHHDTVQPGRDRGIAVNAGGAVGLLPEDVCVSNVPSGFFDHVDVDPP